MMTLTKRLFWLRERPAIFSLFCPSLFLGGGVWGENSDLMSFVEVSAIIRRGNSDVFVRVRFSFAGVGLQRSSSGASYNCFFFGRSPDSHKRTNPF